MKLIAVLALLLIVSCKIKEIDDILVPADSFTAPAAPSLAYYQPASSPSNDSTPEFLVLNSSGGSEFALTTIKAYADGNCQLLVASQYIGMFQTNIRLQLTLNTEGVYSFSANYIDMFGDTSKCSAPLTYEYKSTALKGPDEDSEQLNHAQFIYDEVEEDDDLE